MKINYDLLMQEQLRQVDISNNRILLHSCCGPCSSAVIERLKDVLDITVLYYNPNIEPKEEYNHRKEVQLKLLKELGIPYLDCDYDNESFKDIAKNHETDKEGGARCSLCFNLRLDKTASLAYKNGFNYFGTTLTVSPHKNSEIINNIGIKLEKKYNIPFLRSDFKKRDGYKRSIELSRKYSLYRQDYCGCLYSKQ